MKTYVFFTLFHGMLLFSGMTFAQSADRNYVRTRTMTNETGTAYMETVDYFDGLGRPVQQVRTGASPEMKSIVTMLEYDAYGRQSREYLPINVTSAGNQYRSPDDLKARTNTVYGNDSVYSRTVYESSPLNRVTEQYGPGKEWYQNRKGVKTRYLTNVDSGDSRLICGIYRVSSSMLFKDGNYKKGTLYVTEITDEDGNILYEFKDKLNRVVLIRKINEGVNYDTYYTYDHSGNLTGVLPPMVSAAYENHETLATSTEYSPSVNPYIYIYVYDERNRCVRKKLPGAAWIYYVYDRADRLILSQDGEQRQNGKWAFTIYDPLGRIIMSGIHDQAPGESLYTFMDAINPVVIAESRHVGSGAFLGYSTNTLFRMFKYTHSDMLTSEVRRAYFYDDYTYISGSSYFVTGMASRQPQPSGFTCQEHSSAKGLLVGTLDYYSNGTRIIPSIMHYDEKGQLIQRRTRLPRGMNMEFFDYNFMGQVTKRMIKHTTGGEREELYTYSYDHAGRLVSTNHRLNNGTPVSLEGRTYDEVGRLIKTTTYHLNHLTRYYTYNIRSWLTSISNPLFSQVIRYNEGDNPLYNGNISHTEWTTNGQKKKYTFYYDNLSRLKEAAYAGDGVNSRYQDFSSYYTYNMHGSPTRIKRNQSVTGTAVVDDLVLEYTGNQLKKVTDYGSDELGFIDYVNKDTEYTFNTNGAMKRDENKGIDYSYDLSNGMPLELSVNNVTTRGLNLYEYTDGGQKLSVKQYSDPTGTLQPLTGTAFKESDFLGRNYTPKITTYDGNLIFEDYALKRILTENGYIENGIYYFYMKDHLGNNRLVTNAAGQVVQQTDFYSFGMPFTNNVGENVQPYLFGGKEYDPMHGLNQYNFESRQLDSETNQFTTPDAHAENYYDWSPYVPFGNNPMLITDPTGMDWVLRYYDGVAEYYYDRTVKSQEDVHAKYGKDSGVTHLSTGATMTVYDKDGNKIQYTFILDNSEILYGNSFTIFGTSDKSVNAETLHSAWFGSSYIGPKNPENYLHEESYQYIPRGKTDQAAYQHDLDYNAIGAKGAIDALLSPKTYKADKELVNRCQQILRDPASSPKEKSQARKIIGAFGIISGYKKPFY